jgi:hypothetical protein
VISLGDAPSTSSRNGQRSLAGQLDGGIHELVLALREVVVDRPARRSGPLQDLTEGRALEPAHGQQGDRAFDHLPPGVTRHAALLLDYDGRHSRC